MNAGVLSHDMNGERHEARDAASSLRPPPSAQPGAGLRPRQGSAVSCACTVPKRAGPWCKSSAAHEAALSPSQPPWQEGARSSDRSLDPGASSQLHPALPACARPHEFTSRGDGDPRLENSTVEITGHSGKDLIPQVAMRVEVEQYNLEPR